MQYSATNLHSQQFSFARRLLPFLEWISLFFGVFRFRVPFIIGKHIDNIICEPRNIGTEANDKGHR